MASWTMLLTKIRNIAYLQDSKWDLAGEEQKKGVIRDLVDYGTEYIESDENTD